jgi:hypothetical protein
VANSNDRLELGHVTQASLPSGSLPPLSPPEDLTDGLLRQIFSIQAQLNHALQCPLGNRQHFGDVATLVALRLLDADAALQAAVQLLKFPRSNS